jgi:hypothetical protein
MTPALLFGVIHERNGVAFFNPVLRRFQVSGQYSRNRASNLKPEH